MDAQGFRGSQVQGVQGPTVRLPLVRVGLGSISTDIEGGLCLPFILGVLECLDCWLRCAPTDALTAVTFANFSEVGSTNST